jgi:sugar lactone lactonase YvrE
MKAQIFLDCKNSLGEGCFWDPRDNCLWWTDIEASCVWQADMQGKAKRYILPGRAGFILPRREDGFVIGFPNAIALSNQDLTEFTKLHDVEPDLPQTRVNDATVDPWGGIVFGTFDETHNMEDRKPIGALYRLEPDGKLDKLFGGVVVSNGLAFSSSGETMFFADTHDGKIRRFSVLNNFENFQEIEPLAERHAAPGLPDGGTVDNEGNYWSARVWGGCLVRFDPTGKVTAKIELPTKGPTCVALGGPSLDHLFATTLRVRHDEVELSQTPEAGGVFFTKIGTSGFEQRLCAL